MIITLLTNLYIIILGEKISMWLESQEKMAKGLTSFRSYHSIIDHIVTLRIITKECRSNKSKLLCLFIDFRKAFDTILRINIWNRLEDLKVPFELRAIVIKLYENVITKFKNIEGWSKESNCNI
jgi:hypothetical protein